MLGWYEIPAVVVVLDDVDRMLAEIDENLIRNDLERSEHLAERKRLYLLKHPETKRGGDQRSDAARSKRNDFVSFAADTAAKTDRTERAIQQDVQIAESIPEDVRDRHSKAPGQWLGAGVSGCVGQPRCGSTTGKNWSPSRTPVPRRIGLTLYGLPSISSPTGSPSR